MTQPTSVNIRVTVLVAAAAGLLAAGAAATYLVLQSRYVTSRSDMAAAIPPAGASAAPASASPARANP